MKRYGGITHDIQNRHFANAFPQSDIEGNISTVIEKMEEAKRNGADILLLPECFITGYDLTIGNSEALSEAELLPLCEKAKEWQIGVVATAITKGTEKPQNTAFVIDKNGEIQVCDIETALAGKFEFLSLADGRDINDVAAAVFALVVREN